MRKVATSLAALTDDLVTDIDGFCHGDIPSTVLSFIECLNTPISLFNHEENRFIYVNEPFVTLSGLTRDQLYAENQRYYGLWIQDEDYHILRDQIWERLLQLYARTIHFQPEKLTYMINFRLNEKNSHGESRQMLVQTNVLSWKDTNIPKVTLDLYSDVDHRKHSNKILLTVNHFKKSDREWKMILEQEFLREPKGLASREMEIFKLMLIDKSATEIAANKSISVHTVRSHWRNILHKMGCSSQKELKYLAMEEGWI